MSWHACEQMGLLGRGSDGRGVMDVRTGVGFVVALVVMCLGFGTGCKRDGGGDESKADVTIGAEVEEGTENEGDSGRATWESGVVEGWTLSLRDEGRLKARFAGDRARPVGAFEFDVDSLSVETFRADGELDVVATAPACRVHMTNDSFVISSPGELRLRQADGRFYVRGEGFVWDHAAQRLVVTNRGETRLRISFPKPATAVAR